MNRTTATIASAAGCLALLATVWFLRAPDSSDRVESAGAASARTRYVRLALTADLESHSLTIDRADLISTDVRPLHGAGGFYAVLDSETAALSATPFSFAPALVEEFENAAGTVSRTTATARPSVTVFLPYKDGARSIRVLDHLGVTLASMETATLAAAPTSPLVRHERPHRRQFLQDLIAPPLYAETLTDLEVAFPHIRFITDASELGIENAGDVTRVPLLTPERATALHDALTALGPTLRGSIGSLALVIFPGNGVGPGVDCGTGSIRGIKRGQTVGNQIVINVNSLDGDHIVPAAPAQIRYTLAHESVHAFNNLIDNQFINIDQLPNDIQVLVDDARDNLGYMFDALTRTWTQMQASARIAWDGYGTYVGGRSSCEYQSVAAAVYAGFARPYGANNAKDDVATLVQVFNHPGDPPSGHPVCQSFTGLSGEIPRDKLLLFAKLNFVRGLELITEQDYRTCVQDADPADHDTLRMGRIDFSSGLKAGAIDVDGGALEDRNGSRFVVLGSSSESRGMLQVYARPPYSSPVGFHRLDATQGWMTPYSGPKGLIRRNILTVQPINVSGAIELNQKTRISNGGFALIVNNTPAQTKGYAFFVPMEDSFGRQRATLDLVWFRIEP